MEALNERIDQYHLANRTSAVLRDLRVDNTILDGWAVLSGMVVKAANTRHLAPWMTLLCDEFFAGPEPWKSSLRKVTHGINRCYELMYANEFFMPPADELEYEQCILKIGKHWHGLRRHFKERNLLMFQVTPKLHYVQHFPSQDALINPRMTTNYAEESLMGVLSEMWSKSIAGPHQISAQKHVFLRYLVLLAIALRIKCPT